MPKAQSKVTQITVPLTTLSLGQHGPFTSGLLPSTLSGYQIDFINDNTWPASGNVVTVSVEQSNDSGSTWVFDASIAMAGGQWVDRQHNPVNTSGWSVSLDNQGSSTRKIRVSLNVLQACKIGATVSSL